MTENEQQWFAVYTAARAEKKVEERFAQAGIEYYLPLRVVKRKGCDWNKRIEVPLISGYIFVRVKQEQLRGILATVGVIAILREGGRPLTLPDEQINALRLMNEQVENEIEVSHEEFSISPRIRVIQGELTGLEGELVERSDRCGIMIRLARIGCIFAPVPVSYMESCIKNP